MTVTLDLVLVGFGHVAQRFVALVAEQRAALAREHGVAVRIVGIATERHGRVLAPRGLDAVSLADRVQRGESLGAERASGAAFIRRAARGSAAARERRLVVVEATTLDIRRGQPAIDHVTAALNEGAHVVTSNKGPAAFAWARLARLGRRVNRRFLFEGAVMDGVPIFNLVRETLPGVTVMGFRGVLNATTNFILTAMEDGSTFEDALAAMQAEGIAEADASLDVDGWDAAAKTAALANVLLGARLTPHTVLRQGIAGISTRRVLAARDSGRRVKLVCTATRGAHGQVHASVGPIDVDQRDLLAGLEGQQNAIIFDTDLLGEIALSQRGAGLTLTAYALLADVLTIGRDLSGVPPRARAGGRSDRILGRRGRR